MRGPLFEKTLPLALSEAERLPSLPAVAIEVLRLAEEEDGTIDDLAAAIQRDPALAARLLKLANSSLFNLGQPVTTLSRACMVLGVRTVKMMSLSFCVVGDARSGEVGALDYESFWRRSVVAAVAARAFVKRLGTGHHDEAFVCGLLAHIGQLVLARTLPHDYAEVVAAAGSGWPTLELEERFLGFHRSDVATVLLRHWKLPPLVWLTVGYFLRPDELPADAPPDARELVRGLALVPPVVGLLCDEEKARPLAEARRVGHEACGLSSDEVEAFVLELEDPVRETAQVLAFAPPTPGAYAEVLEAARAELERRGAEDARDEAAREGVDDVDPETGLAGPAALRRALADEVRARCRLPRPRALGLLLVALDGLDGLDAAARAALHARAGRVLAESVHAGELAARAGDERFALVLAETSPGHLGAAALRVRRALASVPDLERPLDARIGGACVRMALFPKDALTLERCAEIELARAAGKEERVSIRRGQRLPRA